MSGITTVILFANQWNITSVLLGAAAGFATAWLFWIIAYMKGVVWGQ